MTKAKAILIPIIIVMLIIPLIIFLIVSSTVWGNEANSIVAIEETYGIQDHEAYGGYLFPMTFTKEFLGEEAYSYLSRSAEFLSQQSGTFSYAIDGERKVLKEPFFNGKIKLIDGAVEYAKMVKGYVRAFPDKHNVFVSGYADTLNDGEIVVSERLASVLGGVGIVGKKLSFYINADRLKMFNMTIDNDNDPNNQYDKENSAMGIGEITILNDYVVKGVVSQEYSDFYASLFPESYDIWLPIGSVDNNYEIRNNYSNKTRETTRLITYKGEGSIKEQSANIVNSGKVFFIGMDIYSNEATSIRKVWESGNEVTRQYYNVHSLYDAYRMEKLLEKQMRYETQKQLRDVHYVSNEVFRAFSTLKTVNWVFFTMGGVTLAILIALIYIANSRKKVKKNR